MSSLTAAARPVKGSRPRPGRKIGLVYPLNSGGTGGLVRISVGTLTNLYSLRRLPPDFGHGFRLAKRIPVETEPGLYEIRDAEVYDVNIDGNRSLCTCLGFEKWGRCKHLGLAELLRRGLI
jgi:hypothetical protein